MQALKALVVIMGILIVAGVVLIVVTIVNRSQEAALRRVPYDAAVAVPAGELVGMAAAPGQVVLRYRTDAGEERLVVIDTERGRVRGTIALSPP